MAINRITKVGRRPEPDVKIWRLHSMHPFCILQEIVVNAGGKLVKENFNADVFGSYWAIYMGNSRELRLVWDGKDGWGFLQSQETPSSWADVQPVVVEGDLESTPRNELKIAAFSRAVERLIAL
jgi:hypothetical protein